MLRIKCFERVCDWCILKGIDVLEGWEFFEEDGVHGLRTEESLRLRLKVDFENHFEDE